MTGEFVYEDANGVEHTVFDSDLVPRSAKKLVFIYFDYVRCESMETEQDIIDDRKAVMTDLLVRVYGQEPPTDADLGDFSQVE